MLDSKPTLSVVAGVVWNARGMVALRWRPRQHGEREHHLLLLLSLYLVVQRVFLPMAKQVVLFLLSLPAYPDWDMTLPWRVCSATSVPWHFLGSRAPPSLASTAIPAPWPSKEFKPLPFNRTGS
jgi:hypothetical protein